MPEIGRAIVGGNHLHDLSVADAGIEGAADAAVGAGGSHKPVGVPVLEHRLFRQRTGRTFLHTGAAGHAVRRGKSLRRSPQGRGAGDRKRPEPAPRHRQRIRSLNILAGSHTTGAGDADVVPEREEGIRRIFIGHAPLRLPVAHLPEPEGSGQVGQRLRLRSLFRLFREIEFDDIPPVANHKLAGRRNAHPFLNRSRAGSRRTGPPLDFADAEPARTEGGQMVRGAEAGDRDPGLFRRYINGVAGFGSHRSTIDGQRNR